jgi:lysophospholipase L1-like esterase
MYSSVKFRVLLCIVVGITLCSFTKASRQIRIFIIGDSTVSTYKASEYPMTGWGQVLAPFFTAGSVSIDNRAIGGRSTRMFYTEDRWKTIVNQLKSDDYIFIQFGHNDRDFSKEERYTDTADYKKYLRLFVEESRNKKAIPVLISPMNMNAWNGTSVREVFCENANDYRGAMAQVAHELDVPFIDLEKKSVAYMKAVDKDYCTWFHFLGLAKGEYPNYPDGKSDGTHFQEMGALANARMVSEGIKELANREDMAALALVLAPLFKVTVASNKPDAGTVTMSGEYPSGVTITLKTRTNSGQIFEGWTDSGNSVVSSTVRYTFKMESAPVTFTARFKNGSTALADDKNSVSAHNRANVSFDAQHRVIHCPSPAAVFDCSGRKITTLYHSSSTDKLSTKLYLLHQHSATVPVVVY